MAFALGSTFLSSSYQVANNLPNMLYELVMAGMLVTAFLPVYISVKKKLGDAAGNEYASNLLTIVTVLLGAVSLLGILFPQAIVYTQTFYSDQDTMGTAVFFFQFFAIQTVFYGGSSILSGLLNANRDYFWSTVAPVANNLIVIATFVLFALVSPANPTLALYIIAIGNPLGVAAQMLIQMPALRRNGIRLRPRVNLRDPALRDTVALGAPTIIVMVCSFVTVSVMNAASYCFADDGPSIITYARLWYALPYSLLAIPITTALFTELTHLARGRRPRRVRARRDQRHEPDHVSSDPLRAVSGGVRLPPGHALPFRRLHHGQRRAIAAFLAGLAGGAAAVRRELVFAEGVQQPAQDGRLRPGERDSQRRAGGAHHAGRVCLPARRVRPHREHRVGVGHVLSGGRHGRVRLPETAVRTRGHHVHRAGPACWARCWAVRARWRASACCRGSSSSSAP